MKTVRVNKKIFNEVIRYITNNERVMMDMPKDEALKKLHNIFNISGIQSDTEAINVAYKKWRKFYVEKDKPIKPMTETMSFRCTPEEKEEISLLLDGRKIKDILLEVLRNE